MKVYVMSFKTESGDDLGSWIFNKKPTDKQLEKILREDYPGEWDDDGPGIFGSYIHVTESREATIIKL